MRYLIALGLLLSQALSAAPVAHYQDQRHAYLAANAMALKLERPNRDNDVTPGGFNFRLGAMADEHWGLELRTGLAPLKDTWRSENSLRKIDYTVDHLGALLLTARLPFESPIKLPLVENLFVQGFGGIAHARVQTEERRCPGGRCDTDTARHDETSIAWGVGAGLRSNYNIGLTLQYMHYLSEDWLDITAVEGGIEWYF